MKTFDVSLSILVKVKRESQSLREASKLIGISPATLSRIENGKVPDLDTFSKLCKWLELDPGFVLGKVNDPIRNK